MNIAFQRASWAAGVIGLLGCNTDASLERGSNTCLAQMLGTYDSVLLARRDDQTLWASVSSTDYTRIEGPSGPLLARDGAASGSSAYGVAIGCGAVAGGAWCFPLAGSVIDSTSLGAGLGPVPTDSAQRVVTALGDGAPALSAVAQIAGGMNGGGATFCAATEDGKAWCWGYGPTGLLGHGDVESASYARPVLMAKNSELADVVEVRVGFDSACARQRDGHVWCWGNNAYGQLGTLPVSEAEQSAYALPVALPAAASRLAASPGNTHCAILADTRVACWGRNEYAQAGVASDQPMQGPTLVLVAPGGPEFSAATDLAPDRGMRAMCANTAHAGLWCWGDVLENDDAGSPYPVQAVVTPQGRISVPLSAFGARDGKLIFVNSNGRVVLGASDPTLTPTSRQPPCP